MKNKAFTIKGFGFRDYDPILFVWDFYKYKKVVDSLWK